MYVCMCLAMKDRDIAKAVREGCTTLEDVQETTLAGTCCGACCDEIEEIVAREMRSVALGTNGASPLPAPAAHPSTQPAAMPPRRRSA